MAMLEVEQKGHRVYYCNLKLDWELLSLSNLTWLEQRVEHFSNGNDAQMRHSSAELKLNDVPVHIQYQQQVLLVILPVHFLTQCCIDLLMLFSVNLVDQLLEQASHDQLHVRALLKPEYLGHDLLGLGVQ